MQLPCLPDPAIDYANLGKSAYGRNKWVHCTDLNLELFRDPANMLPGDVIVDVAVFQNPFDMEIP
jgi:hypothetical protein